MDTLAPHEAWPIIHGWNNLELTSAELLAHLWIQVQATAAIHAPGLDERALRARLRLSLRARRRGGKVFSSSEHFWFWLNDRIAFLINPLEPTPAIAAREPRLPHGLATGVRLG